MDEQLESRLSNSPAITGTYRLALENAESQSVSPRLIATGIITDGVILSN